MRKAVAVPYVIALILGVAAIALVGVWFVTSGGRFSGQAQKNQCNADTVQWCLQWASTAYSTRTGETPATPPSCTTAGATMPNVAGCKTLLGTS